MSEESSCMSSQRVADTSNPPHEPPGRPTVGGSKAKPRFAEFACSHVEVIDNSLFLFPLDADVVHRRYSVSSHWSQRQSFQSTFGEVTRTSEKP
jgi:hypothetical protein